MRDVRSTTNSTKHKPNLNPLRWIGIVLLGAILFATLFLWQAIQVHEREQTVQHIDIVAASLRDRIRESVEADVRSLVRMAARWEVAGKPPQASWEADATHLVHDSPDFQAVEWIDPSLHIRWIVPLKGNEAVLDMNLLSEKRRATALRTARDNRVITISRPIHLVQGGMGFLVYVPIFRQNRFEGFITGVFRLDRLLASLPNETTQGYLLAIEENGEEVYRQGKTAPLLGAQWTRTVQLKLRDVSWTLTVTPYTSTVAGNRSPLSSIVLLTGLLRALVVIGLIYYALKGRAAHLLLAAEAARRLESEERFRIAMTAMHEGLLLHNQATEIIFVNQRAEEILGLSAEQMLGRSLQEPLLRLVQEDGTEFSSQAQPAMVTLREGISQHNVRMGIHKPDGKLVWVSINSVPMFHEGEVEPYAAVVTFSDITERKWFEQQIAQQITWVNEANAQLHLQQQELAQANARLEALATIDGLTGLKNHRTFQEKLAEEYERARRYGTPLSLLLLDVDHFKQFNDQFGHPAGDQVLKQVAATLQAAGRISDVIARYGGEEFVMILPGTDRQRVMECAERIRSAIAAQPWEQRVISISVGATTLQPATDNCAALITEADKALYQSKAAGRNCITHFSTEAKVTLR